MHVTSKCIPLRIYVSNNMFTNTKTEIVFMTQSFLFHTQNKSFHDMVISLVQ